MPLNLRPWQLLALPYLEWLLDDGARRSGRSTTLAVAMIRMAARHPGQRINFWDHVPGHHLAEHVREQVRTLIHEDPHLGQHYTCTAKFFQINLPLAIEDWLPEHDSSLSFLPYLDGFPPTPLIEPQPNFVGGRDSEGHVIQVDGEPVNMSFVEELARARGVDGNAIRPHEDRAFWHDSLDALRYAIQSLNEPRTHQSEDPPKPEDPGPSILDRILADDSDF